MVTINPKKRYEEITAAKEARHEDIAADQRYLCIEVLTWKQVQAELNYWAQHGWRMAALRDGARNNMEMGYRIVLERI